MKTRMLLLVVAALSAPGSTLADEPELSSDIGVSTLIGGGASGFTDEAMRDTVDSACGLWDLRLTLGSHTPLAFEAGYIGTAASINALIGTQSGTLIGTTVEGALRYNVLPHDAINPYAFAGLGWQRYDVAGGAFTTSDSGMADSDNSVVYPLGVGVAYRHGSGFVADVRGTFRVNTNAGLVLSSPGSSEFVPLHTWEASAGFGYEF